MKKNTLMLEFCGVHGYYLPGHTLYKFSCHRTPGYAQMTTPRLLQAAHKDICSCGMWGYKSVLVTPQGDPMCTALSVPIFGSEE